MNEKGYNPENKSDEQALYHHFAKIHPETLKGQIGIEEAYEVTFVTQPKKEHLDLDDSFLISKLDAKINLNRTLLPKFKLS